MANNRKIGSDKEKLAVEYLKEYNIDILAMNYRTKQGEIDIIGKDGECIVFIEVKYRSSTTYGYPEEAVNISKQRKIRSVATYYMLTHNIPMDSQVRFDVISILGNQINHIRNAF